jgi:hypothetical protein
MLQESHITSSRSRRTGPHTRQSRTLSEVLSTPRRTPSQLEALLHSTKNSHTYRGPSSRQEELPHYSRPFFTPERLPVCTRPLINEQSAYKTPHVTTDTRETYYGRRTTASIQLFFNKIVHVNLHCCTKQISLLGAF